MTQAIKLVLRMIASAPRSSADAQHSPPRRGPPLAPAVLGAFTDFRAKLPMDPTCYELRLHEGDGMPDNDFPGG